MESATNPSIVGVAPAGGAFHGSVTLRSAPCSAQSGIGLLSPLPITPSKVLPSPGAVHPSTLSKDRFSNGTTTMFVECVGLSGGHQPCPFTDGSFDGLGR